MSDPGKYRTKDEVEQWKERDPLYRAQAELASDGGLSDADVEAIDEGVIAEMDAAVAFADDSPQPDPEHRFRGHYVEDDIAAGA
jgi:pyruvate dehydrogenase E1 component alpha subunit